MLRKSAPERRWKAHGSRNWQMVHSLGRFARSWFIFRSSPASRHSPTRWCFGKKWMRITSLSTRSMARCFGARTSLITRRKRRPTAFTRTIVQDRCRPATRFPALTLKRRGSIAPPLPSLATKPPNTFNNLGWMTDGVNTYDWQQCRLRPRSLFAERNRYRRARTSDRQIVSSISLTIRRRRLRCADHGANYRNGDRHESVLLDECLSRSALSAWLYGSGAQFPDEQLRRGGTWQRCGQGRSAGFFRYEQRELLHADGWLARPHADVSVHRHLRRSAMAVSRHDVFIHELTHGTSNRLHNNGSGLTTTAIRRHGRRLVRFLRARDCFDGGRGS